MNVIKKHIILVATCLFLFNSINAQLPQNRTVSTIVADALAQLPSNDPKLYKETFSSLISTGDEGLSSLILMLKAPDVPSNEAVEFAISGWTNSVAGDMAKRETAADTYAKFLSLSIDKEIKAFLIRQLALIGGDNQVDILCRFIRDEYLSAPAVQTLSAIRTPVAGKALLDALKDNPTSDKIKINLVNTLAAMEYSGTEAALLDLLQNNPSQQLNEVLLPAIGKTGTETSIPYLKAAVEKSDYSYQKNNAVDSYICLLNRLKNSNSKEVQKEANSLLSKATRSGNQSLRVAAMEILMSMPAVDKTKLLNAALKDKDKVFLTNTLAFYSPYKEEKGVESILKQLQKSADANTTTSLIYWLGNQQVKRAVPAIAGKLSAVDKGVQTAAVKSLSKLGADEALKSLVRLFTSNDSDLVSLVKEELLTVKSNNLSTLLSEIFPESSDEGKVAVLEIIGKRQLTNQYPLVYQQMTSSVKTIKQQAAKSLKTVVGITNLADMYNLLEKEEEYTPDLQDAVNAALSALSPEEQTKQITKQMNLSSKKYLSD